MPVNLRDPTQVQQFAQAMVQKGYSPNEVSSFLQEKLSVAQRGGERYNQMAQQFSKNDRNRRLMVESPGAYVTKSVLSKIPGVGDLLGTVVGEGLTKPVEKYTHMGLEAARGLGQQFDPRYRELSRKVSNKTATEEEIQEFIEMNQGLFLSQGELERFSSPERAALETAKRTAGMASMAIPAGHTFKSAVGLGSLAGGLRGLSEADKEELAQALQYALIGGAAGGVVGGGIYTAGKAYGATKDTLSRFKNWFKDNMSRKGGKYFLRATPSNWDDAYFGHKIDINETVKKYIRPGDTYDDALARMADDLNIAEGKISAFLKNNPGSKVSGAGDDIIKALQQRRAELAQSLGNESKVKTMDSLIEAAKQKYAKDVSAKYGLEVVRSANSKFGKGVIDTETGAVRSSAQKLEANTLRKAIKNQYPDIKGALRTQEEILTLRPLVRRAAGKQATGSSGVLGMDVWKPGTYAAPFLKQPQVSSRLATGQLGSKVAGIPAPNISKPNLNISDKINSALMPKGDTLLSQVGQTVQAQFPERVAANMALRSLNQKPQTLPDIGTVLGTQTTGGTDINTGMDTTSTQGTGVGTDTLGGLNIDKNMLILAMLSDPDNASIYKTVMDVMDEGGGKNLGTEEERRYDLASSGLRGFEEAKRIMEKDPTLFYRKALPGVPFVKTKFSGVLTRGYDSAITRAVEALLRARSGAAVPETEVERYILQFTPQPGDLPSTMKEKMDQLEKDLLDLQRPTKVSSLEGGY